MGRTFTRIHASSVGKFDQGDKIAQWIKANGGQFSREVRGGVTHLISSPGAYKENVEAVKMAKDLKTVKIVTFDWLEDSLLSKTKRPKAEGPYLLEDMFGPKAKGKRGKTRTNKQTIRDPFQQAKPTKGRKPLPQTRERIYTDPATNEEWSIYLVRFVKPGGPREKFSLGLFETSTKPPSYSAFAKYSRTGTSNINILAPPRSTLEDAKTAVRGFFTEKTGKEWKDRFEGSPPPAKKDSDGNDLPPHEGWYSVEFKRSILSSYMMERAPMPIPAEASPTSQQAEVEDDNENGIKTCETPDQGTIVESNPLPLDHSLQMNQLDGSELFEH